MYRALKRRELAISVFTIYELGILFRTGKLSSTQSVESTIRQFTDSYFIKPVTEEIALLATQFPMDFPRDPGDRIIAATARAEDCALVTADERIQRSKLIKTIW